MRAALWGLVFLVGIVAPGMWLSPSAAACAGSAGVVYEIDPVYQFYRQWSYDAPTCLWSSPDDNPLSCNVLPVVQVGDPTPVNGYREGIYLYDCDLFVGSHTTQAVSVASLGPPPVCQVVPPVFVLGQQVPGTGQQYCTPGSGPFYQEVPLDTPDAVQSRGYFRVFEDPFGGFFTYTYFDLAQAVTTCFGPGNDPFLNSGHFQIPGVAEAWFLNCQA